MHSENVLESLREQRRGGYLCDVEIDVKGKKFKAHKSLLVMCSQFFSEIFSDKSIKTITLTSLSPDTFETILDYIYTGDLPINSDNIEHLLYVTNCLQMNIAAEKCQNFIQKSFRMNVETNMSAEYKKSDKQQRDEKIEANIFQNGHGIAAEDTSTVSDSTGSTTMNSHSEFVLEEFRRQRATGFLCDFKMHMEENDFKAQKPLLAACSQYFWDLFQDDVTESSLNKLSPDSFEALLDYMYSGDLIINQENSERLLYTSNCLQMQVPIEKCEDFIQTTFKMNMGKEEVSEPNTQAKLEGNGEENGEIGEEKSGEDLQKSEDPEKHASAKNSAQSKQSSSSGGGPGQSIVFKGKVEGKNVLIGNEVAAVGEGAQLKFTKPLERDRDPSALTSNSEMINGNRPSDGNLNGIPKIPALEDSKIIGCGRVNVQQNTQNVYIPDSGEKESEEEKRKREAKKYKQANPDEVNELIERSKERALKGDNQSRRSEDEEDTSSIAVIIRLAKRLQYDRKIFRGNIDHFKRLCELSTSLQPSESKELASYFDQIEGIDFSGIQANFVHLSSYFRCFSTKKFDYLSLNGSFIVADEIQNFAKSINFNEIEILYLQNCTFEYMALFHLASLLSHVNYLILGGITATRVMSEGSNRNFSSEDARVLSESILGCGKILKLNLSFCDFRNLELVQSMFKCLQKVDWLTLAFVQIENAGLRVLQDSIPEELDFLDLSGVKLKDEGVVIISGFLHKIRTLILRDVKMNDTGLNSLMEGLSNLPEESMDILDISSNIFSSEAVSSILKYVGKVKMILFSTDEIDYDVHKDSIDDETVILSEVTDGKICRLDDIVPDGFSYWAACQTPLDISIKQQLSQILTSRKNSQNANETAPIVQDDQYRCKKCKAHIAYMEDEIKVPCAFLFNDRKFRGAFRPPNCTTVSRAMSCSVDKNSQKKHVCSNCPITGYQVNTITCTSCNQHIGAYYDGGQQKFWCLYPEQLLNHGARAKWKSALNSIKTFSRRSGLVGKKSNE